MCGDEFCVDSSCEPCRRGETECDDGCHNLMDDPLNCGECGMTCGDEEFCVAGECSACPDGETECDDGCQNLMADPMNCGECGLTCDTDEFCVGGGCSPCLAGETDCSGTCVDLSTNPMHCGMCDMACTLGQICMDNNCVPQVTSNEARGGRNPAAPTGEWRVQLLSAPPQIQLRKRAISAGESRASAFGITEPRHIP